MSYVTAVLLVAVGIIWATALYMALRPRPVPSQLVRDRRILEEQLLGEMLRAAGACAHQSGAAAAGCDCRQGRPW